MRAIYDGVDAVKSYKPFLMQNTFDNYARVAIKDEIFNEANDQLTLAIGTNNLKREVLSIHRNIEQAFEVLK